MAVALVCWIFKETLGPSFLLLKELHKVQAGYCRSLIKSRLPICLMHYCMKGFIKSRPVIAGVS